MTALSIGLAGCFPTWEPEETIPSVAWADDDSVIAFMVLRYEWKPSTNPLAIKPTTLKRNFRHQLYVENPDGSSRRAISAEIPGSTGPELYYMKSRGYFVASASDLNGRWFNRIGPTGAVTEVARVAMGSCESRWFDVVPSPGGEYLAVLKASPGCPSTSGSTTPSGGHSGATEAITVTFLDASTLAAQQSQTVTLPEGAILWTWRPAGDFVVASGETAWSLASGRAPQSTTPPRCSWPRTTSSEWSSTGRLARAETPAIVIDVHNPAAAFGCQ